MIQLIVRLHHFYRWNAPMVPTEERLASHIYLTDNTWFDIIPGRSMNEAWMLSTLHVSRRKYVSCCLNTATFVRMSMYRFALLIIPHQTTMRCSVTILLRHVVKFKVRSS